MPVMLLNLLLILLCAGCAVEENGETSEQGWNLQQPAVSLDGTQVAFVLFDGIWVMPIQGGRARQLTSGNQLDDQPRWVPEQNNVLSYLSRRGNSNGICCDLR